jgi:lipopolysaccharide cholinephosphotransferase
MSKYNIPESHRKMLNQLLRDVTEVLREQQVDYFIDGGTLLGAVRNKGQIPWDDDVDLGVMYPDFEKMPVVLLPLLDKGYQVEIYPFLVKVYVENQWIFDEIKTVGTPTLDIFPWSNDEQKYQLENVADQARWPQCWHSQGDLFPLNNYVFDGMLVRGPHNPFPYLERMYPDYADVAVVELRKPPTGDKIKIKTDTVSFPFF